MGNALRLEKTCPKCGSHLMIREGEYGDFLACPRFPACRYTEPLPEGAWSEDGTLTLELRPENNYCKECNHTGLLPFKRKDGSIVPNAFLDCECRIKMREQEQDHFREIRPEDFDFAMSDDFRESTFELYGRPWERRREIYQPEEREELPDGDYTLHHVHHHHHINASEQKQKPPEKSTYKGLVVNE